jgi:hypothetical protein
MPRHKLECNGVTITSERAKKIVADMHVSFRNLN